MARDKTENDAANVRNGIFFHGQKKQGMEKTVYDFGLLNVPFGKAKHT